MTLGLPGASQTTAHPGKPASGQQSHHKFSTLDALGAKRELLASEANPIARARALTGQALEPLPEKAPRRSGLKSLLHTAGKALGVSRGEPKPREHLLRYAGTPMESPAEGAPSGPQADRCHAAEPGAKASRELVAALTAMLGEKQDALDARIASNEVAAAQVLVAEHIDRVEGELGLFTRRARKLSDRLGDLERQGVDTAAELAAVRESIASTSRVLASTRSLLRRHLDALEHSKKAFEVLLDVTSRRLEATPSQQARAPAGLSREDQDKALDDEQVRLASRVTSVGLLRDVEAQERHALATLQARERELEARGQTLTTQRAKVRRLVDLTRKDLEDRARSACQHRSTFPQLGVRRNSWTTLEVVHVFIRRPNPSSQALHPDGQALRCDDPAVGLSHEELLEELV